MWSQICGKIANLVNKFTLKKMQKNKNPQNLKIKSALFFQSIFLETFRHFSPNLRPHFQNSFPKLFFFYLKLNTVKKHG